MIYLAIQILTARHCDLRSSVQTPPPNPLHNRVQVLTPSVDSLAARPELELWQSGQVNWFGCTLHANVA